MRKLEFHRAGPPQRMRRSGVAQRIEPAGWKALWAGIVIAVVLFAIPFTRFVFGYLGILAHELGHTVAYWLFGYPAVPAFDFLFGGGVTIAQERSPLLLLAVFGFFGVLLYVFRRNPVSRLVLAGTIVVFAVLALSPLHQLVTSFMGHGMELLLAGVFLYRGIKGSAIKHPSERPLYVGMGLFLVLGGLRLAIGLMTSAGFRLQYEEAKAGHIRSDFIVIAEDFLRTSVQTVGFLYLVLCLLTPVAAYLFFRREESIALVLHRMLQRDG